MTWDPAQYGRFGGQRVRAAIELFMRVQLDSPEVVHDIGCGRGEISRAMAERWPEARVIGSDYSAEMLVVAEQAGGRVDWQQIDLTDWEPEPIHDLLYANAVLHWIDDHAEAFPRLARGLRPGGVLAVQMPLSWRQPSHATFRRVIAATMPHHTDLHARFASDWVSSPNEYREILNPYFGGVDIWETTYHQVLTGEDPVLQFVKGSLLTATIETLTSDEYEEFEAAYREALRTVYPTNPDGTTTFPFSRLFIVASDRNS